MSERRRPDLIIRISSAGIPEKYELFHSRQFTSARWADQAREDAEGRATFRVRYNGAWLPTAPTLLTLKEVTELIENRIASRISEEKV